MKPICMHTSVVFKDLWLEDKDKDLRSKYKDCKLVVLEDNNTGLQWRMAYLLM